MHTLDLPIVDLDDLLSDDAARNDKAAATLKHGYGELGLTAVAGHGLDQDRLERFYGDFRQFVSLQPEAKTALNRPDIWYQRGWTPPNTEQAVVAGGQPDFKECYFAAPLPLDPLARSYHPELFAENLWPEVDDFSTDYLHIGRRMHEVGEALLGGCERALGLDEGELTRFLPGAAHVSRALSYLPMSAEQAGTDILWGEEHTDFNLLTVLAGGRFYAPSGEMAPRPDDHSGLYLRTPATAEHPRGRMVRGVAPKGMMLSQVGQQLEILTAGVLQATPHVIKAPTAPGWTRASMAHFLHAHAMKTLAPLPAFWSEQAAKAYGPPVLAGTYAMKTLVDIALAPASTLDKLGYRHYDRLAGIREVEDAT